MFERRLNIPLRGDKSFFLFGPRGTGKTTWLKKKFPGEVFVNLLEADIYRELSASPNKIRTLIPPNYSGWVVIDEVQRVPELLNEVHNLIESKSIKFILTGSSARSLRKKGVNLLAGRALVYNMYPLTCKELGENFELSSSLALGHLPARFFESDPKRFLNDYVNTYVREEVLQEGLTRNVGAFSKFLEVASFSQGSVINNSEIARETQIGRNQSDNYFSILEDLLIAVRLPVFTKKAKRKLVTTRKFYYFDVGVFRAIRPTGPLDSPADIDGPALQTLVLQELRATNDYTNSSYEIFFWRTQSKLEVDFVLYGEKGLIAFEIKRSSNVSKKDTRGLREFKKDYPMARCYLLYGGDRVLHLDGATAIPIKAALKNLDKLLENSESIELS